MIRSKSNTPYYSEINDFLETIPWQGRTTNPIFYCLKIEKLNNSIQIYRPPFKRSFYFLGLFYNSGKIEINFDNNRVKDPEAYLVCHSPGLTYSFTQGNSLEGYAIYFKTECFSFFKPGFHKEFPFFNLLHTNFLKLDQVVFKKMAPYFEEVYTTYELSRTDYHLQARIKLLALLYHVREFASHIDDAIRFASPQQVLLSKYVQLVNNHYITKRTVKEYADLLSVTANHLSQSIKAVSGRNALSYITERLVEEAKSLVKYTDFNITEIAYQLGFTDPANFGKFFKNEVGIPPLEFRKIQFQ